MADAPHARPPLRLVMGVSSRRGTTHSQGGRTNGAGRWVWLVQMSGSKGDCQNTMTMVGSDMFRHLQGIQPMTDSIFASICSSWFICGHQSRRQSLDWYSASWASVQCGDSEDHRLLIRTESNHSTTSTSSRRRIH